MAKDHLILPTAYDALAKVRKDLTRKAFYELWERDDFAELRGLLDGRGEAVAERMAWKAFLSALDGQNKN